ncbi:DUF6498-containing protein [Wenzhouxiangella marina]|uniref:Uncharacterized protein n=1 Tax=Wenzhouxiangella marina TaxID=1579979 RepID=A0A0K0XY34_9GAMM|nr:DUF6498-containing protein [Wenzhouxiangella marina]AKS42531.1 hypothetical protein WM2015_2168 [Wenzhouxiangella marina]MBB6085692.1 hypothetical protein [Wenzhouxiangella marina]
MDQETSPSSPAVHARTGWRSAIPDLIGCGLALALAWTLGWRTADLIWSLWLASLVVGYSLILWKLFGSSLMVLFRHGGELRRSLSDSPRGWIGLGLILFGQLFLLAFFTVHFGGFHWGHSVFVSSFFPISPETGAAFGLSMADFLEVLRRYAWFLPLAFLAERHLFSLPTTHSKHERTSGINAGPADSVAGSKSTKSLDMGAAYKGVLRIHLLIFFLFGAHAAGLPDFVSYSVVYLSFFFPWQKVFGAPKQPGGA